MYDEQLTFKWQEEVKNSYNSWPRGKQKSSLHSAKSFPQTITTTPQPDNHPPAKQPSSRSRSLSPSALQPNNSSRASRIAKKTNAKYCPQPCVHYWTLVDSKIFPKKFQRENLISRQRRWWSSRWRCQWWRCCCRCKEFPSVVGWSAYRWNAAPGIRCYYCCRQFCCLFPRHAKFLYWLLEENDKFCGKVCFLANGITAAAPTAVRLNW